MPQHPDSAAPLDCTGVVDRIEAWIDGALGASEVQALEQHLSSCANCSEIARRARTITSELRELPELPCPPRVTEAVLAHAIAADAATSAASSAAQGNVRPFERPRSASRGSWRLAAAAAILLALLGGGLFTTLWNGGSPATTTTAELTPEEIARAELELKLALAYLAEVGREAGTIVRDEMVDNVFAPTRRALR